ncbi:MAG: LytR C-terminal domain-containing protein, partial [Actinomyces graevenitzii]|nr:LytR C-terminal domain-containing protein [Actinomyces graevenitzii]
PTPTQSIDHTVGITVHNGTDTAGLAARAGSTLEGAGFTSVTVSPGVYSEQTPTDSTVYYASEDKEAVAKAVAKELGISNVELSAEQASSNPIVVVLRS